jgi:putative glycosyltransferase
VQERRKGGAWERLSGDLFYRFFNWISTIPIPANQLCARLMKREYVEGLLAHREREIFMAGLWALAGYRQEPLTVKKHSKGSTSYTLRRKVAMAVNAVTSFSSQPLVFIFYLGSAILLLSMGMATYLVVRKLFFAELLSGWASVMVSLWFLGGLTVFCIGIVGIYLAKVFSETKGRPYTLVRKVYREETGCADTAQATGGIDVAVY